MNFFENLGKGMDKDLEDAKKALHFKSNETQNVSHEVKTVTAGDVARNVLQRAGKDVTLKSIDSSFDYNSLMSWCRDNAVGTKIYIVKTKLENSSDDVLCVFFSEENKVLDGKEYPKICYVAKSLNPTLEEMFQNGTDVYVQPIKIVKK